MNNKIYSWIWKWHFIGGLLSLPIIILLSLTGIIYLFKDNYESTQKEKLTTVIKETKQLNYQQQLEKATIAWEKAPQAMILPASDTKATEFTIGRFSGKKSLFINPYTGEVKGKHQPNQTDMYLVRKLHGELLLGSFGTKIVELVACWMFVLLLTGVYLFFPREKGLKGLVHINWKGSKREKHRDIHGVIGFWFSIILVLMLAGGLPWTDVFGGGFKYVQKKTNTGFPAQWQGRGLKSTVATTPAISLDEMVKKANALGLKGQVTIGLPKAKEGTYSISNQTSDLEKMTMQYYDQYTGQILYQATWSDIGILMKGRLWAMAFHQGQFGWWNWLLILVTAIALLTMSLTGILSYLARKQKGSWSIPKVSDKIVLDKVLVGGILLLGILLPLFGASVILIWVIEKINAWRHQTSTT